MADQQNTSEHSPQIFAFDDQMVRTVNQDSEAWFVAMDVASALGYSDAQAMTRKLDEDEVQNRQVVGFGNRGITLINESGLYSSILTSRKDEAKRFKRWVTHEVLPSIRMTGRYELGQKPVQQPNFVSLQQQSLKLINALKAEGNKEVRNFLYSQLEAVADKMGLEAPALVHIGAATPDVPPVVDRFWQVYRKLEDLGHDLNHHRSRQLIAINLKQFVRVAQENGLQAPPRRDLFRALPLSQSPRFVSSSVAVRSRISAENKTMKTWLFEVNSADQEV